MKKSLQEIWDIARTMPAWSQEFLPVRRKSNCNVQDSAASSSAGPESPCQTVSCTGSFINEEIAENCDERQEQSELLRSPSIVFVEQQYDEFDACEEMVLDEPSYIDLTGEEILDASFMEVSAEEVVETSPSIECIDTDNEEIQILECTSPTNSIIFAEPEEEHIRQTDSGLGSENYEDDAEEITPEMEKDKDFHHRLDAKLTQLKQYADDMRQLRKLTTEGLVEFNAEVEIAIAKAKRDFIRLYKEEGLRPK